MLKKIFYFIVLVLFVFSCFPSDVQKLPGSSKYSVAAEVYGPLEVIANITLDKEPLCVAVNDETNRVYVGVEEGLVVLNGETYEVVTTVPMDDDVVVLAINPETNRVFAGLYNGDVAAISGSSNLKLGEIPPYKL